MSQRAHDAAEEAGREQCGCWQFGSGCSLCIDQETVLFQGPPAGAMQLGWEVFVKKSPNRALGFHTNFCSTRASKQQLI